MSTAAGGEASAYGGFRIGAMTLALPMHALREAVPCAALAALPCAAGCVIGGLDLRGVLVPVIDLRRLLAPGSAASPGGCVIVMVHERRLLGLLADEVTGIFTGAASALNAVSTPSGGGLLGGSLRRGDDGSLVSVLAPAALAALPQVPLAHDPLTEAAAKADTPGAAAVGRPVMLLRCGPLALAVAATAVYSTLDHPQVQPSALSGGNCVGVIEFAGRQIAAVDLLPVCQPGSPAAVPRRQAFVIEIDGGFVALLIDAVVEIVTPRPGDELPLPRLMAAHSPLFMGALVAAVLPRTADDAVPWLLLDSAALAARADLAGLARVNTTVSAPQVGELAPQSAGASVDMLTYALDGEAATPLEQVQEILPFAPALARFGAAQPLRGVLVDRGRSIPLLCLRQLLTGVAGELSASAKVLVVESAGDWLGFIVPSLAAIEAARWQPKLGAAAPQRLALVGSAGSERMLPVVDLQAMARRLQGQPAATPDEAASACLHGKLPTHGVGNS